MSPHGGTGRRRRARHTFAALGAALLLTSGCLGWAQKGYDAGEAGYNPTEKTLTAATVAGLQEVWHKPGAVLGPR
jgi:hypothetical protein